MYAFFDFEILDRISRNCPRALSTYLVCVMKMDSENSLFLKKIEISNVLSESYLKFKNNLKMLALQNLLEWQEIDGGIHIFLADDKNEPNDMDLS